MPGNRYSSEFIKSTVAQGAVHEKHLKRVNLKAKIERRRQQDEAYRQAFDAARDATLVSRQLRELRKARGLTQAQVAKLAGTTQQVVSRLEHPSYDGHSMSLLRRVVMALGGRLEVKILPG